MAQVPMQPTPMTRSQALGTFLAAGCPESALLMVAAQSAVETAAWGTSGAGGTTGRGFNNYNFGNVTPSSAQLAAGISWMSQGPKGMRYIAFSDPVSGAKAMLDWLSSHGLLLPAVANDLDGYMAALAKGCYLGCIGRTDSTGHTVSQKDYDNYRAGIVTWMSTLSRVTPTPPPTPQTSEAFYSNLSAQLAGGAVLLTLLAGAAYYGARYYAGARRYAHA